MKKTLLTIALIGCVVLASAGLAMADSQDFTVSASVPFASGITFTITEILASGTWTDNHPVALNFGTLGYDSVNKIFFPTKFFAIDLGVSTGGAGKPDSIQMTYFDLDNPNDDAGNGLGGLGQKATLQITKATLDAGDFNVESKVLLSDVATLGTVMKDDFVGGWPRLYVGMYDGSNPELHTGWEVFTADDAPGDYRGTLQITAVVN